MAGAVFPACSLAYWWPPPKGLRPGHHTSQDRCRQCPWRYSRLLPVHASARDSRTLTGKPGSSLLWGQCCFLLGPGAHKVLFVPSKSLCFPVLRKFRNQIPLTFRVKFPGGFSVPLLNPQVGKSVVGPRTSATVWGLLWYDCSPVCESPGWRLSCGANGDLLQESLFHMLRHPGLLLLEPLSQQQATGDPRLCMGHSNTQRHVWLSLLWRSRRLSLGPGCTQCLCQDCIVILLV